MDSAAITAALQAAQAEQESYLWTPANTIKFTPQVLPTVYGDGRALFAITTINCRPAYWVIRVDSSWVSDLDRGDDAPDEAVNMADMFDEIVLDLEEEFGRAECGIDYEWDGDVILEFSDGERTGETLEESAISYPVVNYGGGGSWSRLDWPDLPGLTFSPHPLHKRVRLLDAEATA